VAVVAHRRGSCRHGAPAQPLAKAAPRAVITRAKAKPDVEETCDPGRGQPERKQSLLHNRQLEGRLTLPTMWEITEATLHVNLAGGIDESRWDPIEFSYGPLKGRASLTVPSSCAVPESCTAILRWNLGELDAATVQTAILGAHVKGTMPFRSDQPAASRRRRRCGRMWMAR